MAEIILNEKIWVENVLEEETLGSHPSETLLRISKYYHSQGYKRSEIERLLMEFVLRCDPAISVYKWSELIRRCSARADKYPLIEIKGVPIMQTEMETVKAIKGNSSQKLLFTLICLARYGNAINPKNSNWVNRASRDVFSLANIKTTVSRQSLMINDLWREGFVGYSCIVDNINLNVKAVDPESDRIAVWITDFRNLGNQYMKLLGENYMECGNCGLTIKRNNNRQKYCPRCAIEINIKTTSENRKAIVA